MKPAARSRSADAQRDPAAEERAETHGGTMREIVHIQAGQCGNQIGTKVRAEFHARTCS